MNNEKKAMEKQELIEEMAKEIWNNFGLDMNESKEVAEFIVDKYAVGKKKKFVAMYTAEKIIYANSQEEANQIFDNLEIDDMIDNGEWSLEQI